MLQRKKKPASWQRIGAVEQVIPYERGVRLGCQNGWVELRWIAADCLRVRLHTQDSDFIEPFSYAVHKVDWTVVPYELAEGAAAIEMRTPNLICRIGKQPLRIALVTLDNRLICVDALGIQHREDEAVRLSMALQPHETSYGMGEHPYSLELRGKKFTLWNAEPTAYTRDTDPLYYSIPFYLGMHQDHVYGLFWDNTSRGKADIGASRRDELVFEAESDELRYYLFAGNDIKNVISRYTELTGRIKLPPLWSLGYQQGTNEGEDGVLKLASDFRQHGTPCDSIYLDTSYMQGFRTFTWDAQRFKNFQQSINQLHEQHFKVIASIIPSIKVDANYSAYKSGLEREAFLKYSDDELVHAASWPGISHFPDFTHPAARAWWAEQIAKLTESGIDGLGNDLSEPTTLTPDGAGTLPDYAIHNRDGLKGTHLENHNVYGMLIGRASQEGLQKHRPNLRPFNMVRSGFAGAQRYASSWTGHNTADWDHLRLSISMALNMGLSGAPMTGAEVGGFYKDTNPELYTRWLQSACLMPFFRSHTDSNTRPQQPWSFGQPYEVINRLTIELRYRLMPYLYAVIAQSKEYGWPIIQPLFMAEPDNSNIRAIDDCYMLGDHLLVAPVLMPGTAKRNVYLPAGQWYDYWTNELFDGGQSIVVTAPLERLPLFVRAGAVIPQWPEMAYVGEKPIETLLYRVYPGNSETVLYEDNGEGLEYEKGDYRWVYITCAWEESKFIISRRAAGRYMPPYKNIKLEIVNFEEEPVQVRVDRHGAPLWFYDEGFLELTIDSFQRVEITRPPQPTDRTVLHRPW